MSYAVRPGRLLCLLLFSAAGAQVCASPCDDAWANYNEFKARTVMEPSQYALTVHGAAVRSACGVHALPVPPGSDEPRYLPHVRPKPPPKPPPKPTTPALPPVQPRPQ
jgi:hypothetical protein